MNYRRPPDIEICDMSEEEFSKTKKRFEDKYLINKETGCWEWQAGLDGKGYSAFCVRKRMKIGHRISYNIYVGEIPKGLVIDHLCKNIKCVNPAHMEPVTQKDNILRGEAPSSLQAQQTHCLEGHPLFGENLFITKDGKRVCRQCRKNYYYKDLEATRKYQREYARKRRQRLKKEDSL